MCQCLSLDLYIWNTLYFGCNVNGKVFVDEGTMQTSLNDGEVGGGCVLRKCAPLVASLRCREHEQFDVFKQLRRDCLERDRLALRVDGQQLPHTSPVDNNGIRTVWMALVDDAVEVSNEILLRAFVLSNHFLLSVGIYHSCIVLLLAQGAYLVGISTCLLIQLRGALDDAVGIPFRLVLVVALAINAGYGSRVPDGSGDSAVDRLNDSL